MAMRVVRMLSHHAAKLLLPIALLLFCASLANAQGYQDLHDFAVPAGTPAFPWLMAQGRDGSLYGVTATGGTKSKGTIFRIGPSGGFSVIHNFDGTHGKTPIGGLTLGVDGNLYGMAEQGGANGYGNIFKMTPAGAFTVLYNFTGGSDGEFPVSPLIIGADGNFYGTSYQNTAFRLTPAGIFTVMASIPSPSSGALLQAQDGSFYAVSEYGGTQSAGAIYRIAGKTAATVYSFNGAAGAFPTGALVEGADGNFYGTTTAGGSGNDGVIYRLTTSGHYRVMFDWDHKTPLNGYQAFAGLVAGADGKLYGATIFGGSSGYGVIFSMTTGGGYSVLTSFDAPHGDGAYATPIQHTNGELFGITNRGGAAGDGVIYSFSDDLPPFVGLVTNHGIVGESVGILGQGFTDALSVVFNGVESASFHVVSDTYMTVTVPAGESGIVAVWISGGWVFSNRNFFVTPQLTGFSPHKGAVGTKVTLSGTGFFQTEKVTVGGAAATGWLVSDSQITFDIPAGAKTGKIVVSTPGGSAKSGRAFRVTP